MEKLRHADLDDVNVQQTIKNLDDAFKSALIHSPLTPPPVWSKCRPGFQRCVNESVIASGS